ncbi:sigma-70 family RNA polymerase sigma factor [Streptomyces sp. NPDC048629]|uniref:sigma-70 family RNA polymerase sigma factor n=1 Tax=Streptomyces sp. NPDC048629 TaxID=3154824 RepID=UPI00341EA40B
MAAQHGTELVRAAQAGDPGARDQLVAAYLPLVYNIVGRALNGHHDVDDVVQETMLRALDGLGRLRSPDSFRSWLVAIAMNAVRSHWHAQQTGVRTGVLDEARDVAQPGGDFVDLTVVRLNLSGQRRETAEATRWLEPDDSALLSLWWLECAGELSRYEVAVALDLSTQHTAVRVQRMKEQLDTARIVVRALSQNPPCPALRSEIGTWDGRPSALWRKRIARHARACARCAGLWSGLVPAEGLLAGLLLVPPAVALLASVRESAGLGLAGASYGYAAADRYGAGDAYGAGGAYGEADPFGAGEPYAPSDPYEVSADPAGFPSDTSASTVAMPPGGRNGRGARRRREQRRQRDRRRAALAAGIAVVTVAGGSFYLISGPEEGREIVDAAGTEAAGTPLSVASSPSAVPSSSSASPSASPSKKPSATPSRPAKPKPATKPATRPASPPPRPRPTTAPMDSGAGSTVGQVIALVNSERSKAGCGPVTGNDLLHKAARGHSDDMAARDFFDHTNPDGDGPGERITAAGYRWSTYGENIAMGQRTPAQVMDSWMNSPGHRANILNCAFKEIGIGVHDAGGPYWTQVFGAR